MTLRDLDQEEVTGQEEAMAQEDRGLQVDREEEMEVDREELDRRVEDFRRMDSTTSPHSMEVEDRGRHHHRLPERLRRWALRVLSTPR